MREIVVKFMQLPMHEKSNIACKFNLEYFDDSLNLVEMDKKLIKAIKEQGNIDKLIEMIKNHPN